MQLLSNFTVFYQKVHPTCTRTKIRTNQKDSCASLRYDYSSLYPKDEMPLHFHPEIEICYVVKGSGYRMIGDFLEPFEEGEVVLVPTNQPHCWMYNPESCEPDGKRRCIVVQFNPDLLQTGLSFLPNGNMPLTGYRQSSKASC